MTDNEGSVFRFPAGSTVAALNSGEMSLFQNNHEREAKELLGQDFIGPREVEKALHITIPTETIDPIPFSTEEIIKAKELGQYLIFRPCKTVNDTPITIKWLNDESEEKDKRSRLDRITGNPGKKLLSEDKIHPYEDQAFMRSIPRYGWALVTKDVIPGSQNKGYLQQAKLLADYLRNKVYEGMDSPLRKDYDDALEIFDRKVIILEDNLSRLGFESVPQNLVDHIKYLSINELTRQTATEAIFDALVYHRHTGKYLLPKRYTWTYSATNNGGLILKVGLFDEKHGLDISTNFVANPEAQVGVCFSRRAQLV